MRSNALTRCALFALLATAGCDLSTNREIAVPAQAKDHHGGLTVNGRVTVGAAAVVTGDLRTVNGSVEIAAGSRTHDLDSVNGDVTVADDVVAGAIGTVNGDLALGMRVKVGGDVRTVNGRVLIGGGSIVDGDATSVNGPLELRGVTVRGKVANHAGDVRLLDGTLIEGDVELAKPDESSTTLDVVVIGVGVQVRGVLHAERPIHLFVHPSARLGRVEGATPVPLEGTDVPPL